MLPNLTKFLIGRDRTNLRIRRPRQVGKGAMGPHKAGEQCRGGTEPRSHGGCSRLLILTVRCPRRLGNEASCAFPIRGHAVCGYGLLSCGCVRSDRLGTPGPQFDEAEQNLVPRCLELVDGARSDLGMDAVDELLLHLWRQYRGAERLPPCGHRTGELLEEMLDAAGAAA